MVMEKQQIERSLQKKLMTAYAFFQGREDKRRVEKIKDLGRKLEEKTFTVAFCGHFSAGKSTMINKLMNQELLPSSPIPTSANLVKVVKGAEHATVYYKHDAPVRYTAPYDFEAIKQFCRDGDAIKEIHLSTEKSTLPDHVELMDTPGIDSADDAHRVATESALHLVDVIFYVTDYNHVQSEVNFDFVKKLREQGKTVYLIVNQIDKHREEELTFEQFTHSVKTSFQNWQAEPNGMFFTSLKKEEHERNEFVLVKRTLQTMFQDYEDLLKNSVQNTLQALIEEYIKEVSDEKEEAKEELSLALEEMGTSEALPFRNMIQEMNETLLEKEQELAAFEETIRKEISTLAENAQLIPYEVREKGREYLESIQPQFKVGFLFSKQKTKEVQKQRLHNFVEALREKTIAELVWHITPLLHKRMREEELFSEELVAKIEGYDLVITEEDIESIVKSDVGITNEYILTYSNDVSTFIKTKAKQKTYPILTHLKQMKEEQYKEWRNGQEEKLLQYEKAAKLKESVGHFLDRKQEDIIEARLIQRGERFQEEPDWSLLIQYEEHPVIKEGLQAFQITKEMMPVEEEITESQESYSMEQTIVHLDKTVEALEPFPPLEKFILPLKKKMEALGQHSFTIALFGAFSAGKSSFANALIGQKLLPVSPNPTTATINKILPPTKEHKHETVRVHVKSEKEMFSDISASLHMFGINPSSLDEALDKIKELKITEKLEGKERLHYSFLQAVSRGYEEMKNHFDTVLTVSIEEFPSYVANEQKSCFVDEIELYYSCALTDMGITIVDTPGADSINARHTGVAFQYVKDADALLFVTYYNHAFSRADREFLIQLGRVKDIFTLDKMFFVINAADLAHDENELLDVKRYVYEQLLQYGIRKPRLYPLSSHRALESGVEDEQFNQFWTSFSHFIKEDLTTMVTESAYEIVERAYKALLDLKELSRKSKEEKRERLAHIEKVKQALHLTVQQLKFESEQKRIRQETEELVHYVKQRVMMRYYDFFKESFNPSVLKGTKKQEQEKLRGCLNELLEFLQFDFVQEIQATTLRLEAFSSKLIYGAHEVVLQRMKEIHDSFAPAPIPIPKAKEVTIYKPFEQQHDSYEKALSLYRNARAFFEGDEKKKMVDELKKPLLEEMDEAGIKQTDRFNIYYAQWIKDTLYHYQHEMNTNIEQHIYRLQKSLTTPVDIREIEKSEKELSAILTQSRYNKEDKQ